MIESFKRELKILWIKMSAYYQTKLNDEVLEMYVNDVQDLDFESILRAMQLYRLNSRNTRPPLPAHIRALVDVSSLDPEISAREAVSRILRGIMRFGYSNAAGAQEFIGELGWYVVERYGGWQRICEDMGVTIDREIFQAQARELAKGQIILERMGQSDYRPTLKESTGKVHEILTATIKQIGSQK